MTDSKKISAAKANGRKPSAPNEKPRNVVLRLLGPGLVTGAADDDPSGIATYSQAGAQFGYGLLWTVFLTTPFMIAIQVVSAKIGRVTGKGIVGNLMQVVPRPVVLVIVALLLAANTFNIAADIAAMGEALSLVIGGLKHEHALIFAAASVLLQVFVPYRHYAPVLKFATLILFLYVATAFTVKIPWGQALAATVLPQISLTSDYLMMVVAVLGTTISPYLFFWQASQEVEEMHQGKETPSLRDAPLAGKVEMKRIAFDTTVGMILSNTVAFFIILTTAAVLNAHGVKEIHSAADAANALKPLAGELTFFLFALGIIGTGMLAIPVLAGSAAYCVADAMGWRGSLEAKAAEATGFYSIVAAATIIGFALTFTPFDPMKMLVWSAVLNGIVAIPVMIAMMLIVTNTKVMKNFAATRTLTITGWAATAAMLVAVLALGVSSF
jgi:NRAMP (natural resistance-associated macrophage protein)-like metal ion transporter